jgi:transposase-like protein
MSLSSLGKVLLKHACPQCGHELEKSATWFRAIRSYKCETCKSLIVMTYDMKLKLCAQYEHRRGSPDTLPSTDASNRSYG